MFAGADPGLAGKKFLLRWEGTGQLDFGNVDVQVGAEAGAVCLCCANLFILGASPGTQLPATTTHLPVCLPTPACPAQAFNATRRTALLQLRPIRGPDTNLIVIINLVSTSAADPLRNLRLLPPGGGICTGNPLRAVAGARDCPPGAYRSFAAHHASILFNPEFLADIKRYRWATGQYRQCGLATGGQQGQQQLRHWHRWWVHAFSTSSRAAAAHALDGVGSGTALWRHPAGRACLPPAYRSPPLLTTRWEPTPLCHAACTRSLLRFMDWQSTNNNPTQSWGERALPSHQFWMDERRGVPLEVLLALANVLGADPWLCIPHRADDAYVTAFAQVPGGGLVCNSVVVVCVCVCVCASVCVQVCV